MSFFEYMISLLELKEKFTTIANYGLLIFSFSLFILTLSFIIYGFMSISILVILYYIILIVSLKFVDRLTEDKNLSPRQSRAYGQLFLEIFLFSSIGLTLMLAYSGLTKNIDPNLLAGIPFLIMFNFFILLGILKAIDVIRNGNSPKNPPQYSQQLLYTQRQTFKLFNRPFPLPDVVRNFRLRFRITNDGVSDRNSIGLIIGLIFVYIVLIFIMVYLDYLAFKSLLAWYLTKVYLYPIIVSPSFFYISPYVIILLISLFFISGYLTLTGIIIGLGFYIAKRILPSLVYVKFTGKGLSVSLPLSDSIYMFAYPITVSRVKFKMQQNDSHIVNDNGIIKGYGYFLTDNGKVVKGIIWSRSLTSPYSGEAYVINDEILFAVDGFDIIVNSLANQGLAVFSLAYQKKSYPTGINSSRSILLISVISILIFLEVILPIYLAYLFTT